MKVMRVDFDGCVKRFQMTDTECETIQKFLCLSGDYAWNISDALGDCNVDILFEDTDDVILF